MNYTVLYHEHCMDGMAAAWVASRYLPKDDVQFIAANYAVKPKYSELRGACLYILDWCPEMADLDYLCTRFDNVTLIDHHQTAIDALDLHVMHDDMKHNNLTLFLARNNEWSGAMGTAMWFHENSSKYIVERLDTHWMIRAIDDRDRWQFKLLYTRDIHAWLSLYRSDLQSWLESSSKTADPDISKYTAITVGNSLLQKMKLEIELILKSNVNDYWHFAICNAPYHLASEIGNRIADKKRLAVIWNMDNEENIKVSLRSHTGTHRWVNCGDFAKLFDGGGHANAAGFTYHEGYLSLVNNITNKLALYTREMRE